MSFVCVCALCAPTAFQKAENKMNLLPTYGSRETERKNVCVCVCATCSSVIDDHFLHIGYAWRFPHTRYSNANNTRKTKQHLVSAWARIPYGRWSTGKMVEEIMGNTLTKTKNQIDLTAFSVCVSFSPTTTTIHHSGEDVRVGSKRHEEN